MYAMSVTIRCVFIELAGYMVCNKLYLATMMQLHMDVLDNRSPDSRGRVDRERILLRRAFESAQCGRTRATMYAALRGHDHAPPVSQNGE